MMSRHLVSAALGLLCAGPASASTYISPEPGQVTAGVVLCNNSSRALGTTRLGSTIFGAGDAEGCNPCNKLCPAPVAVEQTTWGGIKSLFTR